MTNPYSIKIAEVYREPEADEFFFLNDPYRTTGVKQLLEWLEINHGFEITPIEKWKIKSWFIIYFLGTFFIIISTSFLMMDMLPYKFDRF